MKSTYLLGACAAMLGVLLGVAVGPASARSETTLAQTERQMAQPDPRSDIGRGELLIVMVAGNYATTEEARRANDALAFDEIEGFQVVASGWFDEMKPGRFVLVTAFRTVAGADIFEPVARALGAKVSRIVTHYRGPVWIGLGQEAHPNGRGPLNGPLPLGHPSRIGRG